MSIFASAYVESFALCLCAKSEKRGFVNKLNRIILNFAPVFQARLLSDALRCETECVCVKQAHTATRYIIYIMVTRYTDLVFDLGGVILDIDRELCVRNLQSLGLPEAGRLLDLYCQSGDFLALEEGNMTAGQFFDILRRQAQVPISDADITDALCSFICGLPAHRLDSLAQLRKEGKRLFVLSNTNPIMYHSVIDRLFRQRGLCIRDYFDAEILSFQEKVCKPSPGIFNILIERYGLNGSSTLFLDDSAANCEAARACGIDAALVPAGTEFTDILNALA